MNHIIYLYVAGWLKLVGSLIVYELDYRKSIIYIQIILGKLPASCCPRQPERHRNNSIPPVQRLSWLKAGSPGQRLLPDVVCQLLGSESRH